MPCTKSIHNKPKWYTRIVIQQECVCLYLMWEPLLHFYCINSIIWFSYYIFVSFAGEVVHITILTQKVIYTNIENTSPYYQCYPSAPDEDATLEFGRTAPIPGNSEPDLPADGPHKTIGEVRVVTFPDTSAWDRDGFGPFFCQGTKEGKDVTKVTTFFIRSDGKRILEELNVG